LSLPKLQKRWKGSKDNKNKEDSILLREAYTTPNAKIRSKISQGKLAVER